MGVAKAELATAEVVRVAVRAAAKVAGLEGEMEVARVVGTAEGMAVVREEGMAVATVAVRAVVRVAEKGMGAREGAAMAEGMRGGGKEERRD